MAPFTPSTYAKVSPSTTTSEIGASSPRLTSCSRCGMPQERGTQHSGAAGVRRVWFCDGCEVTVVDDYTVELQRPEPRFDTTWDIRHPFAAGVAVHSKKHVEAVGEEAAITQSVATGPWQMEDFRSGDFFLMKGVRDHYRSPPNWDEFQWSLIKEDSTRNCQLPYWAHRHGKVHRRIHPDNQGRGSAHDRIHDLSRRDLAFRAHPRPTVQHRPPQPPRGEPYGAAGG